MGINRHMFKKKNLNLGWLKLFFDLFLPLPSLLVSGFNIHTQCFFFMLWDLPWSRVSDSHPKAVLSPPFFWSLKANLKKVENQDQIYWIIFPWKAQGRDNEKMQYWGPYLLKRSNILGGRRGRGKARQETIFPAWMVSRAKMGLWRCTASEGDESDL